MLLLLMSKFGGGFKMNRQSRRHPTHPALPILYPSKGGTPEAKVKKAKAAEKAKKISKPKKNIV